jgi:AcrR family transcriptional regulator
MSPRRRKAQDAEIFAALVRVMMRRGPAELTLRAIAAEAGVTASALVQRFGSKRALLLAHARHAAATGDVGLIPPALRAASPLAAIRALAAEYAQLAGSPRAAVRNLAYLQHDLADPQLRRHLLRLKHTARAHYEQLLSAAVGAGQLRDDVPIAAVARLIDVTLDGSFLSWAIHRKGAAVEWFRHDLDAVLRPYLARSVRRAQ